MSTKTGEIEYIGFTLNEWEYTIPILKVREIIKSPQVTRIPILPAYVEGLAIWRQKMIPMINMKSMAGMSGVSTGELSIIVGGGGVRFGFFVDRITGIFKMRRMETESQGFVQPMEVDHRSLKLLDMSSAIPETDRGLTYNGESIFMDRDA